MLPQVRKSHIGIRVTPELREVIELVARKHHVTISDVVLRYVIDRLVAEGYVGKERKGNDRRDAGHPPVATDH